MTTDNIVQNNILLNKDDDKQDKMFRMKGYETMMSEVNSITWAIGYRVGQIILD